MGWQASTLQRLSVREGWASRWRFPPTLGHEIVDLDRKLARTWHPVSRINTLHQLKREHNDDGDVGCVVVVGRVMRTSVLLVISG